MGGGGKTQNSKIVKESYYSILKNTPIKGPRSTLGGSTEFKNKRIMNVTTAPCNGDESEMLRCCIHQTLEK